MRMERAAMEMVDTLLAMISDVAGRKSEIIICEVTNEGKLKIIKAHNHIPEHAQGLIYTDLDIDSLEASRNTAYAVHEVGGKFIRTAFAPVRIEGTVTGCIILNTDITDMVFMQKYLSGVTGIGRLEMSDGYTDINQLLDNMLEKALNEIGKPVAYMKKADKRAFIKYLDDRGCFQIKKSTDKVMKYLDISKFTLYSHLEEIRTNDETTTK